MRLLNSYAVLLYHSELRQQSGERRLAALSRQQEKLKREALRLQGELDLQTKLQETPGLSGVLLDKAAIFGWLRKHALMRRKTQELRLELDKLEEAMQEGLSALEDQRRQCVQLERRRQKFADLVKAEKKAALTKMINQEELELEDRVSWWK